MHLGLELPSTNSSHSGIAGLPVHEGIYAGTIARPKWPKVPLTTHKRVSNTGESTSGALPLEC